MGMAPIQPPGAPIVGMINAPGYNPQPGYNPNPYPSAEPPMGLPIMPPAGG